jgi:hypothetical protein
MFGWTRLFTHWLHREGTPAAPSQRAPRRQQAADPSAAAAAAAAPRSVVHTTTARTAVATVASTSSATTIDAHMLGSARATATPTVAAHAAVHLGAGTHHAATDAAVTAAELPSISADQACRFTEWLFGQPGNGPLPPPGPLTPAARSLLRRLDGVIEADGHPSALLPRAPQVLPQLMKALRNENYASTDVSARISQDAVLAAEVIRQANNAQRHHAEPVADLEHAVMAIGANNLRRIVATSLLRPMFDARGTTLSAQAAQQIWADADRKARLCALLATASALDPLDGYLAGLLHNTGWTAALRAIDSLGTSTADLPTLLAPATVQALLTRRDKLFGKLVRPWLLSTAVDALADEIAAVGLPMTQSPLGLALKTADRLTTLHALDRAGHLPGSMLEAVHGFSATAQDCYREALTG